MASCIFCEILAGAAEGSFVYRDEGVAAFMDLAQWTPGHLLVVPNVHAEGLGDLDPETGGALFRVAMRCARAIRASMAPEGIGLHLADGAAAGQEVFHVHLHVIPRSRGDGFGLRSPHLGRRFGRAELDARARAIRAAWR